jgi:hypothetical protein
VNFCESVRVAPVKRREVMAECIVEVPSWLACLCATAAPREMCRLLRIAEEYDKLGERLCRVAGPAHNFQPRKRPNSRSAPRIVADVVTLLEISLAPTFDAGRFRQERNIRKSSLGAPLT